MTNASVHHTGAFSEQQEGVALLVLNGDGSLTVHPAAVQGVFPGLISSLLGNGAHASPSSTLRNVEAFPGIPREGKNVFQRPASDAPSPYVLAQKESFNKGRLWASKVRRLMKQEGITRYKAIQLVAQVHDIPVTDVRMLVEYSNKRTRQRGNAIRRAILWKWHCEGSTHKASSARFPFPLHEKTVASDIKEIRQQQYGGRGNVR